MAFINVFQRVYGPFHAFRDRHEAGLKLVEFLNLGPRKGSVVLALPRGGLPVAAQLAEHLDAPLGLALVRKLPVPGNPEAGFGAVALDGSRVLNDYLVDHFGIQDEEMESITEIVKRELQRRAKEYLDGDSLTQVEGKQVYLVDDGLATGYTALAAARMLEKRRPASLVICVPVSPWDSIVRVQPYFDEVHALYVQERGSFAVASYYVEFRDLSDSDVRMLMKRRSELLSQRQGLFSDQ